MQQLLDGRLEDPFIDGEAMCHLGTGMPRPPGANRSRQEARGRPRSVSQRTLVHYLADGCDQVPESHLQQLRQRIEVGLVADGVHVSVARCRSGYLLRPA